MKKLILKARMEKPQFLRPDVGISATPGQSPSQRQRRETREKGGSEERGTYIVEEGLVLPRLLWTKSSRRVALHTYLP
jgi:hypothetical protein